MKSLLAADVEEELCRQPITDADMEKMPRCRVRFQFLVPRIISISGAAYNFNFWCRVQFQFLVPRTVQFQFLVPRTISISDAAYNFNFWCRVQFQFLVPRTISISGAAYNFNFWCHVQFQFLVPRDNFSFWCRVQFQFLHVGRTNLCRRSGSGLTAPTPILKIKPGKQNKKISVFHSVNIKAAARFKAFPSTNVNGVYGNGCTVQCTTMTNFNHFLQINCLNFTLF